MKVWVLRVEDEFRDLLDFIVVFKSRELAQKEWVNQLVLSRNKDIVKNLYKWKVDQESLLATKAEGCTDSGHRFIRVDEFEVIEV